MRLSFRNLFVFILLNVGFRSTLFAQDWQEVYDQSISAYNNGNYAEATTYGQQALELSSSNIARLFTLKILSATCQESGDYRLGTMYGWQEIDIYPELDLPDSVYANSLESLGANYMGLQEFDTAATILIELKDIKAKIFGIESLSYNQTLSNLGYSYFAGDNFDSAYYYFNTANVQLIELDGGAEDFLFNMLNIGQVHFKRNETEESIKIFKQLSEILEDNGLESDLLYAQAKENLGQSYIKVEDFESAEKSLTMALKLYHQYDYSNDELAELVNYLALASLKIGNTNTYDSLLATIGGSQIDQNLLINQLNLSTEKYASGQYDESKIILQKLKGNMNSSEVDEVFIAEFFLMWTKLNLALSGTSGMDTLESSIQIFQSKNMLPKVSEAYYLKGKIFENDNDLILAESAMEKSRNIIEKQKINEQLKYQIYSGLIHLKLQVSKADSARQLYNNIINNQLLSESYSKKLSYDYSLFLQNKGYVYEASGILSQLVALSDYPELLSYQQAFGNVLLELGIFTEAHSVFEEIEEYLKETNEQSSIEFGLNLSQMARIYLTNGDYILAEKFFLESIAVIESNPGENLNILGSVQNSFAIYYQTIANYDQAMEYYVKAGGNVDDRSQLSIDIIQNMATLAQLKGDNDKSIALLGEALTNYEYLFGDKHPVYGVALQNLSNAYEKNEEFDKGIEYILEALEIDKSNNLTGSVGYSSKMHNHAVLLQENNELDLAEQKFKEVLELRKSLLGENHPDYVFSVYNMAVLMQKMNKNEEASEYFNEAITKYLFQVDNFFPYLSESEKSAYYSKIKETFSAYQDFAVEYSYSNPEIIGDLFNFQLRTKAILLNSSLDIRSKIAASEDISLINTYDRWVDLKKQILKLYGVSRSELLATGQSIEALEKEANILEKEISSHSDMIESVNEKNILWTDIREALDENSAAIEIFRVRKNIKNDSIWYVGLIIKKNTINHPQIVVFENGKELESRLFKFYINNIKFKKTDMLSFDHFWKPLYEAVADVDKVYLSPDGIFNKINFITLYNPQTEKYVLNEISINYLTNTSVILDKTNNGNAPVEPKIQLFGNADFSQGVSSNNSAGPAIDPLPGTGEEIREISSLLESKSWSSTVFENSNANEKSLKETKDINILHIATHGFFLSDKSNNDDFYSIENNPLMRSGLLLTSAQNAFMGDHIKFSSGEDEDGVLTAYEVMNMDLSGTQLVVLSACETGLGEVKNGEGVYGLQRAFIIAGAESLIISLWKVSDGATRDLMIRFYEIYLENHNKFEALALAQKDMLEKYKDPYYWGAFVMSGI